MKTTRFELNMLQFFDYSPIPLPIRIRLALAKLGMKFDDDGKLSAITNKVPTPMGTVTWQDDYERPWVRFYKQELN